LFVRRIGQFSIVYLVERLNEARRRTGQMSQTDSSDCRKYPSPAY